MKLKNSYTTWKVYFCPLHGLISTREYIARRSCPEVQCKEMLTSKWLVLLSDAEKGRIKKSNG